MHEQDNAIFCTRIIARTTANKQTNIGVYLQWTIPVFTFLCNTTLALFNLCVDNSVARSVNRTERLYGIVECLLHCHHRVLENTDTTESDGYK